MTTPTTIAPAAVHAARQSGQACLCIDVRTPIEHRALHAEGVISMPLDALDAAAVRALRSHDQHPIYLFCKGGSRAAKAAQQLSAAGLSGCVVVEGGTDAWAAAGLPVVRGKAMISLERQVRIAAGSLVLTGVALGYFVHVGFLGLAGFVGAGLIFAGVTDWCGMALMLAKMPWNRVAKTVSPVSSQPVVARSGA